MMLQVISLAEAQTLAADVSRRITETERLPLACLPGRVAAGDIFAGEDIPAFCRSTMDGYAVRARNVFGAGEAAPVFLDVVGEVRMGEPALISLPDGACAKIPTGGMLPEDADAVVPVEYTELSETGDCLVYRAVSPFENVTRIGDDVKNEARIIPAGTRLTPAAVGVLAAAGISACDVLKKPAVGILSTGNEILPTDAPSVLGKVRDVNTHLLEALCGVFGCETKAYGIIPDRADALCDALLRAAAENDIVLLSGGSSAGEMDLTVRVIEDLGEVLSHGIAIKPGKPTVIGKIGDTPVVGLPGHPAACYFVAETVVRSCVEAMTGAPLALRTATAKLSENISSNHGREEFLCVSLREGNAVPVYGKSGVVSQLANADGYLRIPRDSEGLRAGAEVKIYLF